VIEEQPRFEDRTPNGGAKALVGLRRRIRGTRRLHVGAMGALGIQDPDVGDQVVLTFEMRQKEALERNARIGEHRVYVCAAGLHVSDPTLDFFSVVLRELDHSTTGYCHTRCADADLPTMQGGAGALSPLRARTCKTQGVQPQQVIERGLVLLRAGHFLAAHECFEAGFRTEHGRTRTLLHALAQLSAGHHQLSLGRARAAANTWSKACRKLASVGLLSAGFAAQIALFCERFGLFPEGARFVDLSILPAHSDWPYPDNAEAMLTLEEHP